jgi:hypothetical protein
MQRLGRFQGLTGMLASGQQFCRSFANANFNIDLLLQIVFLGIKENNKIIIIIVSSLQHFVGSIFFFAFSFQLPEPLGEHEEKETEKQLNRVLR